MSIEFTCPSCLAVLRTAVANAAVPAFCPACGDALAIPASSERRNGFGDPFRGGRGADTPFDAGRGDGLPNIFVCDLCGTRNLTEDADCRNCGEPSPKPGNPDPADSAEPAEPEPTTSFTIDEVVSTSWHVFRSQFGPCILGSIVSWFAMFAGVVGGFIPIVLMLALLRVGLMRHPAVVVVPCMAFVFTIVLTYSQIGLMIYTEHVIRERRGNLGLLFRGSRFILRMLVLNLVFWGIVGLGLMAFVVPGIIAYTVFWPAAFILVEQDCSAFEALGRARRLTRGHRGNLFLISLVDTLIMAVGSAFAGFGLLAANPLSKVLLTVTYLRMTGQLHDPNRDPWVEEYATDPIVDADAPLTEWLEPDLA